MLVDCCFLSSKFTDFNRTIVFTSFEKSFKTCFSILAFMDHNIIHTISQNNLPSTKVNSFGQFIIIRMLLLKQLSY